MNKGGAMNPTEQPQGNFVINLNFRRNGNAKAPPITGRISTPEEPEVEFNFSAFRHDSEKGPYWIGSVDMNRTMRQALNATPVQGTNFVAIRENGFKVFKDHADGSRNPAYAALTPDQQKAEDAKPSYWATWTRTENEPQLRAAAWEREPTRYGPWASGNTQHPLTKEQLAELGYTPERAQAAVLNQPEAAQAPRRGTRAKAAEQGRA
jgi:hypothetical protein